MYNHINHMNSDDFISSFAFLMFVFIFYLIRTSNTMLNRSNKSKLPCLVDYFKAKLSVCTINIAIDIFIYIKTSTRLRNCSFSGL